jgi:hypothetical protein
VKAQAARAMGTVATKLGGTIAPATQKRLTDLLLAALAGRTWTGKECVLRLAHILLKSMVSLKGQCHEIFGLWFFSSNNPTWAPD